MVATVSRCLVLIVFVFSTLVQSEIDPLLNELQLNDDEMDERQACPNAVTCPANAQRCDRQNCAATQSCCIDQAQNIACCWPVNAAATTTTAAPTVALCSSSSKYGSVCRSSPCTRSADCGRKRRCCRPSATATPCCVSSYWFGV